MKDNEIINLYWSRDEAAITATANTYDRLLQDLGWNTDTNTVQ